MGVFYFLLYSTLSLNPRMQYGKSVLLSFLVDYLRAAKFFFRVVLATSSILMTLLQESRIVLLNVSIFASGKKKAYLRIPKLVINSST